MAGQGTCFDDARSETKKKDSVYHQVKEFLDKGETLAVATIVSAKGSTPREVGAKMVVTAWGEILGTIGGGCGEADVKREAIEVIRTRKPRMVRVDLLDDISSDSPAVVGAGHIAVPLAKIAKVVDFHVTVIDDRLLYANRERFPDADEVLVGDMAQMLKEMTITPSCYIVLITRGHKYDEPCLREIIHSQAKYIGMIGSRRRIKACFQRFRDEEKIAEEMIERVYAPIGLDIATETPAEIALSILGEVIKVRRGGKAASLSDR